MHVRGGFGVCVLLLILPFAWSSTIGVAGSHYDLKALNNLKVKESAGKKAAYVAEYARYKDQLKAAEMAATKAAVAAMQGKQHKSL
jgi:hypothetical protein